MEIDIFVGVHGGPAEPLLWFDLDTEPDPGLGTLRERFAATPDATATLQINWNNGADPTSLHRVLVDWILGTDGDGSNGGNNISRNEFEGAPDAAIDPTALALVPGDNAEFESFANFDNQVTGVVTIDVTEDVSAWAEGEPNFGWGFIPSASQGGEFQSFEHPDESGRPQLILLGPDGSELLPAVTEPEFLRGDATADGTVDITDGVFTLNFLFQGGPQPTCSDAADSDDSGTLNISDGVFLFNYLFLGGSPPPPPGPADCGPDPTAKALPVDPLDCGAYEACG